MRKNLYLYQIQIVSNQIYIQMLNYLMVMSLLSLASLKLILDSCLVNLMLRLKVQMKKKLLQILGREKFLLLLGQFRRNQEETKVLSLNIIVTL